MNPASPARRLPSWLMPWLLFGVAALVIALAPLPVPAAAASERHFRVEASSFEYSPPTLRVNPGDRVTIELASTDVVHGLYLDGYGLDVVADPGQPASLTFTADKSGTFRFRCSVTCGALHPFMIGKLTVGPNALFWKGLLVGLAAVVATLWSFRPKGGPQA